MVLADSISFACSACGHAADFPRSQEGKAIYCPKCQAAQVVRGSGPGRDEAERIPTGRIAKAESGGTDRIEKPHGMAGTARIDFVCGACNHTSRISAALSGQPVRCPTCGTVQLAGVTGLRVVRLDEGGKLPFTCTACAYQARLGAEYAGKAIRCPKCQGAQVVPRVLRDPSGAYQALPSGASVVRSEPGTGQHRKPATGQHPKPATGPIAKPVGPPTQPRSEPSAALRTPAGGIPVAQPMATPTPLPGSLVTPPPGSLRGVPSAAALATPLPGSLPPPPPTETPLPPVQTDASDLDLDAAAPKPRSGGVVRRSGRMSAQRTPPPPPPSFAEPTLEPARAVTPDPLDQPPAAPEPARPAPRAYGAPAVPMRSGPPAWLVPVLGVVCVVAIVVAVVMGLMMSGANTRAAGLESQLTESRRAEQAAGQELAAAKLQLVELGAARTLVTAERDEQRAALESVRKELESVRADLDRVRAEAAAASPPAGKPAGKKP